MTKARRVIVCEDEKDGAETYETLLRLCGFEVFSCQEAIGCLRKAREWSPAPPNDQSEAGHRVRRRKGRRRDLRNVAASLRIRGIQLPRGYRLPQESERVVARCGHHRHRPTGDEWV